ncbi:MAG: hypothetical protein RL693_1182 [Verrucomicrobiota bacterium]|jgi:hypothetical protein
MTETSIKPAAPLSVEDGVNTLLCNARKSIRQRYQECEQHVRKSPTTSVLTAVAAGYCLHRLPVRSILATQVRLLAALAPPALFLFGAAKVCEFLQHQDTSTRR